jgi:hypothetical protein
MKTQTKKTKRKMPDLITVLYTPRSFLITYIVIFGLISASTVVYLNGKIGFSILFFCLGIFYLVVFLFELIQINQFKRFFRKEDLILLKEVLTYLYVYQLKFYLKGSIRKDFLSGILRSYNDIDIAISQRYERGAISRLIRISKGEVYKNWTVKDETIHYTRPDILSDYKFKITAPGTNISINLYFLERIVIENL